MTAQVAEPDAVITLPWCDISAILGVVRRGPGDPTYRIEGVGAGRAIWKGWRTPEGPVTVRLATQTADGRPVGVMAWCWGNGSHWIAQALPRMLGGKDDATGFVAHHPEVEEAQRRHAGWAVPWTGLVVESLVPAIIEQRITGAEAFTSYRRLVRAYGEPAPGVGADRGLMVAPDARGWASIPSWAWVRAGIDASRSDTIMRALRVAHRLEEHAVDDPATATARLRAVPGIGVWTAAEVAHVALGDADAVSFGDYHVAKNIGWALTGEEVDDHGLERLLAPYAGHRYRVQRLLELSGAMRPRRGPRRTLPTHLPTRW